jgi:hypothetical protein
MKKVLIFCTMLAAIGCLIAFASIQQDVSIVDVGQKASKVEAQKENTKVDVVVTEPQAPERQLNLEPTMTDAQKLELIHAAEIEALEAEYLRTGDKTYLEKVDCLLNPDRPVPVRGLDDPPVNDDCTGALVVAIPSSTAGDITEATHDAETCGTNIGFGLWYAVVGTGDTLTASTCNAAYTFDTEIAVFCNICENLVCIATDDDGCDDPSLASIAEWCSDAGVTYYILVGYYTQSSSLPSSGTAFQLDIIQGQPCSDPPSCEPPVGRCCYGDILHPTCIDNIDEYTCTTTYAGDWTEGIDCSEPCPVPPQGRCCYGDPLHPDCVEETEYECTTIHDGWWAEGLNCHDDPCPIPEPGENCQLPYEVTDEFTYSGTTCGFVDDYNATCMGSYDGGEDFIFEWEVAHAGQYTLTLTAGDNYTGMAIDDVCPLDAGTDDCIVKATTNANPDIIECFDFAAGTYYIMVDIYPSPYCDTFELTAVMCVDEGRCCYGDPTAPDCIAGVGEADCYDNYGGLDWVMGGTCDPEDPPCPIVAEGDNCLYPRAISGTGTWSATTCGAGDDYDETCMGYYDGDEDYIFEWTVTVAGDYTFTLDAETGVTYTGIGVDDTCPLGDAGECIVTAGTSAEDEFIDCTTFDVGTYYIMVDIWPSPDYCFAFDLIIDQCADVGRCCYGDIMSPTCIDNVSEDDCITTYGGTWTMGIDCSEPCPVPMEGDFCDIAFAVPGLPFTHDWSTVGYNDDYDLADAGCYGNTSPDVCYAFTPAYDMDVNITTCLGATDHDTELGVQVLRDAGWEWYACISDVCNNDPIYPDDYLAAFTCLPMYADSQYCIIVDGYSSGSEGEYTLFMEVCPEYDCNDFVACGTPVETEDNWDCLRGNIDPHMIVCDDEVYGIICPFDTDHDLFPVTVPPMTVMFLYLYDGEDCLARPTSCVMNDLLYDDCSVAGSGNTAGWRLTNNQAVDWNLILDVYLNPAMTACISTYKIEATCCDIVDYCANPIIVPWTMDYTSDIENTCCASNFLAESGSGCVEDYTSGNDVVWKVVVDDPEDIGGTIDVTVLGPSGADEQLWICHDCTDPVNTCVASADDYSGNVEGETVTGLAVTEGEVLYIIGSFYGTYCGQMMLFIDGDVYLPVELTSFTALSGDNSVTLSWETASESNVDHFEISRDGEMIAEVDAANTAHVYSYVDNGLTNGTLYNYSLVSVDINGDRRELSTTEASPNFNNAVITEYALHQNYPNPFNPSTSIVFDMVDAGFVTLKVYNLLGQSVSTVMNSEMNAGRHTVNFTADNLSSGIYLYRLEVNGFTAQNKMVLMK